MGNPLAGLGAPLVAGVGSLVGGLATNAWNAREARKNREFQERMSSTAWQREVADMKKAGINPMAKFGSGASTPSGDRAEARDPVTPAVATALQAKLLKAQVENVESQTSMTRTQEHALRQEWQHWKPEQFNLALDKARAEIEMMASSARAARAKAALDEAARTGAVNQQELEQLIGEFGPAVRFFLNMIRGMRRPQ